MNTPVDRCEEAQALLGSYALGSASNRERALIDAVLPDCPDLQRELAEYDTITDSMLHQVPQIAPPPSLRASILAEAEAPRSHKPLTLVEPTLLERWQQMIFSPMGAAAALALIALFVSNGYWLTSTDGLRGDNRQLVYDIGHLQQENVVLVQEVTSAENLLNAIGLNRGGRAQLMMNPEDVAPVANMAWTLGATDNLWIALFSAENLPPLNEGVYQLWLEREDQTIRNIGTFAPDEEGRATLIFEIDEPIGSFATAEITIEPLGGSEAPSENQALIGDI